MSYVNTRNMLIEAKQSGYAVGAFNAENMEFVQAIIEAAQEMRSPVIIQTTPGSIRYAGLDMFVGMVKAMCSQTSIDIALHLDHGDSVELCEAAIKAGYSSVMYDGSKLDIETNIINTSKVVGYAQKAQISVEAELGMLKGKEDDLDGAVEGNYYTKPEQAQYFLKSANVDSLAIAVGTAHGIYKGVPVIDIDRIKRIRERVSVPLVLHGASGLEDNVLRQCTEAGISKINFATELRIAFNTAVSNYLLNFPSNIDSKNYLKAGRTAVYELVKAKIAVCGSSGKQL